VASLISDELERIVPMLCARYPQCSRGDVARLVAEVYAHLAANATVTTHLIPLTLNRCRRELSSGSLHLEKPTHQPMAIAG
jgi:hypothetical protein